jgi:hypothetical protein
MTNETVQTASTETKEPKASLSLNRVKVADSARLIDSRNGYGQVIGDMF